MADPKETWKRRARLALRLIEGMAPDACKGPTKDHEKGCFPCAVYRIAHSVTPCGQTHGWWDKPIETYKKIGA